MMFVLLVFLLTRSAVSEQFLIYFLGLGLLDCYAISQRRFRLFNAVWLSALAFLAANNAWFVRFLEPLSATYAGLDSTLASGALGVLRTEVTVTSAFAFTFLCVLYLRSVYDDLKAPGILPPPDPGASNS